MRLITTLPPLTAAMRNPSSQGEIVRRVEDGMPAPPTASERKTLDALLLRIGEHAQLG